MDRLNDKLEDIKKQQNKQYEKFHERFERNEDNGSYLLTTVGCMKRHDLTKEEMYLTDKENNIRDFNTSNRAEREERVFVNQLSQLISKGLKPLSNESLEEFVVRNSEYLDWRD